MADPEVPPDTSKPEAGPGGPSAAEKPLRRARVSRPERPSRAKVDSDIAEVNVQIKECQKRIDEIREIFDNQKQGRHGMEREIQEAKRQLAGTMAQFKAVLEQKKALKEQMVAADDARKRMRDEARSLRDRLTYVKEDEIDQEIKKIEYRLAHTSLTLQEEKRAVQQIRDLTKSKEFVKDYVGRMEKISADEDSRSDISAKIKEKDELLTSLKQQEQEQKAAIDQLYAKGRVAASDLPALGEEREKKYAEVKLLREKINAIWNDFREKEEEYWVKEKEWRAQQAEDRKKAYEEREAYRKEKEARRKAWEAENFVEPYTDEIIICDQLVAYLEKLRTPGAAEGKDAAEGKKAVAAEGFGKMVVSRKNRGDEELDGFFGGMGKQKKKKGASRANRERGERFISHPLDAIASFGKIKVTPPTSTGEELDEAIGKIKSQKEEFVRLQAADRERRAKGLPIPKEDEKGPGEDHQEVGEGEGEKEVAEDEGDKELEAKVEVVEQANEGSTRGEDEGVEEVVADEGGIEEPSKGTAKAEDVAEPAAESEDEGVKVVEAVEVEKVEEEEEELDEDGKPKVKKIIKKFESFKKPADSEAPPTKKEAAGAADS